MPKGGVLFAVRGSLFCSGVASPRRGHEIPALRTVRAFKLA
jgi:hypothetical protein